MHVRYAVAIREEYELNTFIVFDYYPISAGVYCKHHTYPRYICRAQGLADCSEVLTRLDSGFTASVGSPISLGRLSSYMVCYSSSNT